MPSLPDAEQVASMLVRLGAKYWHSSVGIGWAAERACFDARVLGDFEDGPAFDRNRIFWAELSSSGLAVPVHDGARSRGLFSFDGTTVRYLHFDPLGALASLLRNERRALHEHEAVALARLFAEVVLRERERSAIVVGSLDAAHDLAAELAPGWRLSDRAVAVCTSELAPPRVESPSASSYRARTTEGSLVFCAAFGPDRGQYEFAAHRFDVDHGGTIRQRYGLLAKPLFVPR